MSQDSFEKSKRAVREISRTSFYFLNFFIFAIQQIISTAIKET